MEPFNSPNRGNDILSSAKYLKRAGWISFMWPDRLSCAKYIKMLKLSFNDYCVKLRPPPCVLYSINRPLLYNLHWPGFISTHTGLKSHCILRMDTAWSRAAGGDLHWANEFNGVINITLICPRKDLSKSGLCGNLLLRSYEEHSPTVEQVITNTGLIRKGKKLLKTCYWSINTGNTGVILQQDSGSSKYTELTRTCIWAHTLHSPLVKLVKNEQH